MSTANGTINAEAGPSNAQPIGMGANGQANGSGQLVNGTSTQANGTTPADAATEEAAMPDMNQLYQARRDEEAARRDRSLAEFLVMLDGYKPLVS